jgi:hypothetical protein
MKGGDRKTKGHRWIMKSCPCWLNLLADLLRLLALGLRPRTSLAAENLFLRKQLAFYQERAVSGLDGSTI